MKGRSEARALLAVTGGVAVFAVLVERAGLLAAVAATTLVATRGAGRLTPWAASSYAAALAVLVALLFVGGLGQPIPLLPVR
jgi:hypothetical protein